MNTTEPTDGDAGILMVNGKPHMKDARERLIPLNLVDPKDALRDHMVRKITGFGRDISAQIARFRGHCFDDIASFMDLLAQEYGVKPKPGAKGNMTFTSVDGCLKVQIAIADQITFGPELQIAKELIDECIVEWAEDSRDEIRALINRAFEPHKEGKVNREALFSLRSLRMEDERWKRAVDAINDAIRVVGSKEYVRIYERPNPRAKWDLISIDMASAKVEG